MKFSVNSKLAKTIRTKGSAVNSPVLSVKYIVCEKLFYSPVISKKQGNAVERNKVKRQLRAIFSANSELVQNGAYLLFYRGFCREFCKDDVNNEIRNILQKISNKRL